MNQLAIILIFFAALGTGLMGGVATAFALVYIPVLLLLDIIPSMSIERLWDLSPSYAAVVGMAIALVFEPPTARSFKWNIVDWTVILLAITAIISGMVTEQMYTGVNFLGLQMMGFVLPYYFARITFRSPDGRRKLLWALVACSMVMGFFALVEMRLWPFFYRRLLQAVGLVHFGPRMAYYRFGLFRAESTMDHPIYLGNACLSAVGMIMMLAAATGITLRNQYVWYGLLAAGAGLLGCLSFSPYNGLLFAAAVYFALLKFSWVRNAIVPIVVTGVLMGLAVTISIAEAPMPVQKGDGSLAGSLYIRQLIIKNSWDMATSAGPFGHGRVIRKADINLDSVDNTYVLFAMTRGWVFVSLWCFLGIAVAMRVGKAFRACVSWVQVSILSAGMASVIGIMVAMYTVWAGWAGEPYTMMWLTSVAATTTAAELILAQNIQIVQAAPRGFEALARTRSVA